jgi:penicillin-binding protein 1A
VVELARAMGVSAELPAVPALVLGSGEVSVLDMATAYSTFANRGSFVASQMVTRVEDSSGRVLWSAPPYEPRRVLQIETADAVTTALTKVIEEGTGTQAKIPNRAAGKTGTTEDYRDAWFVGYSCRGTGMITTAVWMGYPGTDGQPVTSMTNVHGVEQVGGGTIPAQMWSRFMTEATKETPTCELATTTKFPGEEIDVESVDEVKGIVPSGGFRTTTTAPPATTASSSTTASSVAPPSSAPPPAADGPPTTPGTSPPAADDGSDASTPPDAQAQSPPSTT